MSPNQIYVTPEGVELRWDNSNNMWMINSPTNVAGGEFQQAALHQYILQKQQQHLQAYPNHTTINPPYNFDRSQQQHVNILSEFPTTTAAVAGAAENGSPQQQQQTDDELMFLFDVIHRKSVRLRKDIEVLQQVKSIKA